MLDPNTWLDLTNDAQATHDAELADIFAITSDTDGGVMDSDGIDLSALGLGCGGLGAKLNPNMAPAGQHANVELAGKLSQAKQVDASLSSLLAGLQGAINANQAILLASPNTAGQVDAANAAITDLQNAQAALEGTFWNGQNFNSFQGSTDAWNLMDQAAAAAQAAIQKYQQLARQIAGAVTQAKSDAAAAANVQAQQAQHVTDAQNTVNAALQSSNIRAASGDFDGALAVLSDAGVASAANTAGMTSQVNSAIASIGDRKSRASSQSAADALAQKRADDLAAAQSTRDVETAKASASTQQAAFDLQKFQAQLAADAQSATLAMQQASADRQAQAAADAAARQDELARLQIIMTAAPLLGHDEAAAALVQELGLDPNAAAQAAAQAGAGSALGGPAPSSPSGVEMQGGFFAETAF